MKKLPVPRPVTKGFYNQWLNERPAPIETEAIGGEDVRQHDWDQWQGLEDGPVFGFDLRKTHGRFKVEEL